MANLSQIKRQRMLEFLNKIREEHREDDTALIAIAERVGLPLPHSFYMISFVFEYTKTRIL